MFGRVGLVYTLHIYSFCRTTRFFFEGNNYISGSVYSNFANNSTSVTYYALERPFYLV